jgi:hypothetical protein
VFTGSAPTCRAGATIASGLGRVRYRIANSSSFVDSAISEIGVAARCSPREPADRYRAHARGHPAGRAAAIVIAGRVSYRIAVRRLGPALRQPRRGRSPAACELIRRLRAS